MSGKRRSLRKTVYTTAYLRVVSWHALKEARDHEEGRFYNCTTCILFSAFCLEAYCNHLGEEMIPFWESIDRISIRNKLEVLSIHLDVELDFSCSPFQSFTPIFRLRNRLAHGRNERLFEEETMEIPETKWQEEATLPNAERYFEDTKGMIEYLHEASGLDKNVLWIPEVAGWWEE